MWAVEGTEAQNRGKDPRTGSAPESMCECLGVGQEPEEAGRTERAVGTESKLDPELQQGSSPGLPLSLPTSHAENLRSRWTYRASAGGHVVGKGGPRCQGAAQAQDQDLGSLLGSGQGQGGDAGP